MKVDTIIAQRCFVIDDKDRIWWFDPDSRSITQVVVKPETVSVADSEFLKSMFPEENIESPPAAGFAGCTNEYCVCQCRSGK